MIFIWRVLSNIFLAVLFISLATLFTRICEQQLTSQVIKKRTNFGLTMCFDTELHPTSYRNVFKTLNTRRCRYGYFYRPYSLDISVEYHKNSKNKWNGIWDMGWPLGLYNVYVQYFKLEKATTRTCKLTHMQ